MQYKSQVVYPPLQWSVNHNYCKYATQQTINMLLERIMYVCSYIQLCFKSTIYCKSV